MIVFTSLYAGAALSGLILATMMFAICVFTRQTGYMLTMAVAVLIIGLSCAIFGYARYTAQIPIVVVSIILSMTGFSVAHRASRQYLGEKRRRGLTGMAMISLVVSIALFLSGYDGLGYALAFFVTGVVTIDVGRMYWSHRRAAPSIMLPMTAITGGCGLLLCLRALPILLNQQWSIGAPPENWAENLTAFTSVPCMTAFGAMVLALHHVRAQVNLQSEVMTDPLTRLLNRRALDARYGEQKFTPEMGMIMLDLDHFKRTNDVFGHVVGDEVLVCFASVLARQAPADAELFRLGGEEFALIIANRARDRALGLAAGICTAFGEAVVPTQLGPLRSTVSAGVAFGSARGENLQDMMVAADSALYEAKRAGRNQVVASKPARQRTPVRSASAA